MTIVKMKLSLFFVLFLFLSKAIFAQEVKEDSLLTKSQNDRWISEFEKITSKGLQIEAIKNKIQSDTSYTIERRNAGVVNIRASSAKAYFECKILFALWFKKESVELKPNQYPETSEILDLIAETDIYEIIVLDRETTYAIFGTGAIDSCCSVIMFSQNRKLKRKLKDLSLQY